MASPLLSACAFPYHSSHSEHGALDFSDWLASPEAENLFGTGGFENGTWEWLVTDQLYVPEPSSQFVGRSTEYWDQPYPDNHCRYPSVPNGDKPSVAAEATVYPQLTYTNPSLTTGSPENPESPTKAYEDSNLHDFLCANNCSGNFIGLHQCFRHRNSLIISCSTCASTFRTRNSFTRHYITVHQKLQEMEKLMDCPVEGCKRVGKRGFKRKDNLLQHRRGFHGEDIPKVFMRFGDKGVKHRKLKAVRVVDKKGGSGV